MTATKTTSRPPINATQFAANVERITNEASFDEAIALFHDDAVTDWIIDGVREYHVGIDAIQRGFTVLTALWRQHHLQVQKRLECASADTIVLTWRGGFRNDHSQFGTEIWTFRDNLVIHHQMYGYLNVRPRTSLTAAARLFTVSPRIALSAVSQQVRYGGMRSLIRP
ncbi:nuclear transport factor 2 family protein [Mycolicibacterium farcinogenes]|uniref:Uncharacterized protein n=1 Tax=Mycolicibacterium farcinogenes TaxID=1802 RepID=A0ACD1FQY5_MYCFR|nr:hypothetical protein [Mycolicibacterium farcinogenes]QZH69405.1 hypothetical protein K6L26_30885 [Mycolicibacterium farcinogenes]